MSIETMSPIEARLRAMLAQKYVAIIRVNSAERAYKSAQALIQAGFRLIEVTMTVPGALDVIKDLAAQMNQNATEGVMIGAGTVMDAPDARRCIENGAQFVVSPICETDIIRPCRDAGGGSNSRRPDDDGNRACLAYGRARGKDQPGWQRGRPGLYPRHPRTIARYPPVGERNGLCARGS